MELSKQMREAKKQQGPGFPGMQGLRPPVSSPVRSSMSMSSPSMSSPPRGHDRDILREQIPIPRKLVRGQDMAMDMVMDMVLDMAMVDMDIMDTMARGLLMLSPDMEMAMVMDMDMVMDMVMDTMVKQ